MNTQGNFASLRMPSTNLIVGQVNICSTIWQVIKRYIANRIVISPFEVVYHLESLHFHITQSLPGLKPGQRH